ncbi:MAG: TetR/AcrR family transcriptional regulator [Ilumatobacteraceae bacterium]
MTAPGSEGVDRDPGDRDAAGEADPRVERSRRVICEATLDELAKVGYGSMTIESIARRAGVGKATVYRHWDGKLDLVADALRTLRPEIRPADHGSARDRIVGMLSELATMVADSEWSACMPALVSAATRDDALRAVHHRFTAERRQVMVDLIAEGIATGELVTTTDPELLAEILAGPIFYRRLMTPDPLPPERVHEIVDQVLPA